MFERQPRVHFINDFSIKIQIWLKFHFVLIQIFVNWSLQNFAHQMTGEKIVAIWCPVIELQKGKFSIKFEIWIVMKKIISDMGLKVLLKHGQMTIRLMEDIEPTFNS